MTRMRAMTTPPQLRSWNEPFYFSHRNSPPEVDTVLLRHFPQPWWARLTGPRPRPTVVVPPGSPDKEALPHALRRGPGRGARPGAAVRAPAAVLLGAHRHPRDRAAPLPPLPGAGPGRVRPRCRLPAS